MNVDDFKGPLAGAPGFKDKQEFLRFTARQAGPGLVCEFGVGGGTSTRTLASAFSDRVVHGFDSFFGLPETWNAQNPVGTFNQNGVAPSLPDNVRLHVGLFDDTLPEFLAGEPGPVSFVHVDCDLYSSTRTVLTGLSPRFIDGTVLHFDEFWDYPEAKDHEAKAFAEFLEESGWSWECLGRVSSGGYSPAAFVLRRS